MITIRFCTIALSLLACLVFAPFARGSTNCDTALSSGIAIDPMKICISNDGNLVGFASPARVSCTPPQPCTFVPVEHIRIGTIGEGYAVCNLSSTGTTRSYDAGFDEGGWSPPTVIQPNGPNTLPLTIIRTTTNGGFQLSQSFSVDTSRKEVIITMNLKNLSVGSALLGAVHARLVRYVDFDVDSTSATDVFFRTHDTVFAEQATTTVPVTDGDRNAMSLTAATPATPVGLTITPSLVVTTTVERKTDWSSTPGTGTHTGCSFVSQTTPTAGQTGAQGPGDYIARVTFDFLIIKRGQSRTVTVVYRRQ